MTSYHPTSDQARGPLQRLLDNENLEIAKTVEELRRRTRNKAKLEVALLLVEADEDDLPGEKSDSETTRIAAALSTNGGRKEKAA